MRGGYYFALFLTVTACSCGDPHITGRWMHVAYYPETLNAAAGVDTSFLVLNGDSTFRIWSSATHPAPGRHFEGNYAGTWRLRNGKILELTLPPRQEYFVMAYHVLRANRSQLALQPLTESPDTGAMPVIFRRTD